MLLLRMNRCSLSGRKKEHSLVLVFPRATDEVNEESGESEGEESEQNDEVLPSSSGVLFMPIGTVAENRCNPQIINNQIKQSVGSEVFHILDCKAEYRNTCAC